MPDPPPALPPCTTAVRLLWVDYAGIRRARVVPAARWPEALAAGVSLARCCALLGVVGDVVTPGAGVDATGDVALRPATGPLTVPHHPAHAVSLCSMVDPGSGPSPLCPRAALERAVAAAAAQGLSLRFGFESEFLLRPRTPPPGSLPPPNYAHARTLDAAASLLDAIVASVEGLGAPVEQWHAESGRSTSW